MRLGASLTREEVDSVLSLLREFVDIFAWSHVDMPGVLLVVAQHRLKMQKGYRPIRQRLRWFYPTHYEVTKQEVDKLLAVGFIKEI